MIPQCARSGQSHYDLFRVDGDKLIYNYAEYDLSVVPEGGIGIPSGGEHPFVGQIVREDGELCVTVICRFPDVGSIAEKETQTFEVSSGQCPYPFSLKEGFSLVSPPLGNSTGFTLGVSSSIDLQLVEQSESETAAKAECSRRISEVVSQVAQINLASNAAAGLLDESDQSDWLSLVGWINLTRNAWPAIVENKLDLYDDSNWPSPTEAMKTLGSKY